jgi:hypothetical protein
MKSVFFSPFSAVWLHTEVEISYAKQLENEGSKIVFLSCNKSFDFFCNSMATYGLNEYSSMKEKDLICEKCMLNSEFKRNFLGLQTEFIESYISPSDKKDVLEFITYINKDNWHKLKFDGISVGRYAAYETFLRYKIINSDINSEIYNLLLKQIQYCALVARLAQNYFSANGISKSIVYNENYALNKTFQKVAQINGVETISIQANGPLNQMYSRFTVELSNIGRTLTEINQLNIGKWEQIRDKNLSVIEIYRIFKIINSLMKSKSFWVYSIKTKQMLFRSRLRRKLQIPKGKKVILVSLSSQDEWFGSEFTEGRDLEIINQIDYIERIVEFCSDNPDFYVIIRPHPREFANKRENRISDHSILINKYFKKNEVPINVYLNTPTDNVSIYQIFLVSDYVFNLSSSIGLEANLFGKRVLSIYNADYQVYPKEFNLYLKESRVTKAEIENLSKVDISINSILAFRWLNFKYFVLTQNKYESNPRIMFKLTNLLRHFYLNFTPLQTHTLLFNKFLRGLKVKKLTNHFFINKYFQSFKVYVYKMFDIFNIRNKVIENLLIKLIVKYISRRIFLIHN